MTDKTTDNAAINFSDLGLSDSILKTLSSLGYETPSPIQAEMIPHIMAGRDVLGQAQTGTGKTAAFALPLLQKIDLKATKPQVLVLAPTRELAIQVAEAFQKYAEHLPNFHVLPIYGGQSYGPQLSALRRGVQVIVGTPGRVIDHLEKNSLDLSQLKTLVLDEADEMLRMGFIDDVETIIKKSPETRQVALFSATMPSAIKRIAQKYLKNPIEVHIESKTRTADNIRQRFWQVSGLHKLDALTRILEVEPFDAMIVFARTKLATDELAQKLKARGFSAAAINGDINQQQRERTIGQLKDGGIDILVATDVAARGLDVDRISHVVNYDVPYDTESYVHRIGRTGRAGRSGEAILFLAPRERNMLRSIERATNQPIEQMDLPSVATINDVRIGKFKQQITDTLATGDLKLFRQLVEDYEQALNVPAIEIAAALAKMARGNVPLLLDVNKREERAPKEFEARDSREKRPSRERDSRSDHREPRESRSQDRERPARESKVRTPRDAEIGMETYRIEVGFEHGVKPSNIVGAIANEAGLDSKHMGRIEIFDDYALVDLPEGMPKDVLTHLKTVWCAGQQLRITKDGSTPDNGPKKPRPPRRPDTRVKPDTVSKKKRSNESFFEFRQGKKKPPRD
ncbi:MAG: DEAD/DEAH box helicase [Arenimonas sp.]|nr:DEAD/DEAH box helicase [Arenimonas sp.]